MNRFLSMIFPDRSLASFAAFCLCALLFSSTAQAAFHAQALQKDAIIKLDGKLDDAVWKTVTPHSDFYQTQPYDNVAAHLRTEVRVVYDDKFLYVGVVAYDNDPSQIRDSFARRDKISVDQDFFALYIDPSSGHKAAQVFYVNARGAVMDGIYSDTSGDDTAPDYEFSVGTARFDGGWSAEYKIPFASIAYDKHSSTPWSLLVLRNMTRDQRYRIYSGAVTRATSCNLCFSNPIEGMQHLPSGVNWNATPQLVMRRAQDQVDGKPRLSNSSRDLSLDLKFRPSSAITIDATLNPDFSQIELDSPQLSGNTRFGIFVQEKRPFFLEGADIFRTPLNAISTRTIASPDLGLRYTQRDADKDFSILSSRDTAGALVLVPQTYFTAYATSPVASTATDARANFRLGPLSIGVVVTDRQYADGHGYNRVAGPDFVWQIDRSQLMRAQVLMSSTNAQLTPQGNLERGASTNGHAAYFDFVRSYDLWALFMTVRDISQDFRADNGFFPQVGFRSFNTELTKKFGRVGILNEFNTYVSAEYKVDRQGQVLSKILAPGVRIAGPFDSSAYVNISPTVRSRVKQDGELFAIGRFAGGIGASPGKQIARISADFTLGDVIDIQANRLGRGGSYTLSAKLRPIDRLEIEPSFASNWIDRTATQVSADGTQRSYTETALQINGILHLSAKDTIRMILQNARTTRDPRAYSQTVAAQSSRNVSSFVYTHHAGVGSAIYLGWTVTASETPGVIAKRRQSELFTKFSWKI